MLERIETAAHRNLEESICNGRPKEDGVATRTPPLATIPTLGAQQIVEEGGPGLIERERDQGPDRRQALKRSKQAPKSRFLAGAAGAWPAVGAGRLLRVSGVDLQLVRGSCARCNRSVVRWNALKKHPIYSPHAWFVSHGGAAPPGEGG